MNTIHNSPIKLLAITVYQKVSNEEGSAASQIMVSRRCISLRFL